MLQSEPYKISVKMCAKNERSLILIPIYSTLIFRMITDTPQFIKHVHLKILILYDLYAQI